MQETQVRCLCATTTELARLNEGAGLLQTTEPTCSGAHVPQLERENPHATTREKPECCNEETVCLSEDPACRN